MQQRSSERALPRARPIAGAAIRLFQTSHWQAVIDRLLCGEHYINASASHGMEGDIGFIDEAVGCRDKVAAHIHAVWRIRSCHWPVTATRQIPRQGKPSVRLNQVLKRAIDQCLLSCIKCSAMAWYAGNECGSMPRLPAIWWEA